MFLRNIFLTNLFSPFPDNADLSPLTVLDNMNLKTEFPYSAGTTDVDKPPDINSITLDSGAENLFQFAASGKNRITIFFRSISNSF